MSMAKRGRKPMDPKLKEELLISRFNLVKELMEKGWPQYKACKKLGINRAWLYKNTTPIQKKILDEIHFSFSQGTYPIKQTYKGGEQ
jgi:hypothetical protein